MSRTLAHREELVRERRIEKQHGLGVQGAVLRGSEDHRVDAGALGDIGRVTTEPGNGVGEPRAVQLDAKPRIPCDSRELGDRGRGVDGSPFCRLGKAEDAAVRVRKRRAQRGGVDPRQVAGDADAFPAGDVEPGRAFLRDRDVGLLVAVEPRARFGHRGEGERVGCRAGGDGEYPHVGLENPAENLVEPGRDRVFAVGRRWAAIGRGDGRHHGRVDRRHVVAHEIAPGHGRVPPSGDRRGGLTLPPGRCKPYNGRHRSEGRCAVRLSQLFSPSRCLP